MTDLDELTKEELIELLRDMDDKVDKKPYDPDSLMAMALATPKDARAISWRRQHPAARFFIVVFCAFIFLH